MKTEYEEINDHVKRIGSARDIAHLAVHLMSDSGSWITGQVIHADGGMGSLRVFKQPWGVSARLTRLFADGEIVR
ncbi:MAG: SDR family oxidoreductase [Desulfobacterales bacterium]|nr:MAG: SDR family oxidoreductase [Desulfobacterales bacterium]